MHSEPCAFQRRAWFGGNRTSLVALAAGLWLIAGTVPARALQMEGPNSPGSVVDDASFGTSAWTNPANAATSDNMYAVTAPGGSATHYLKATSFGFGLPGPAVVRGIQVDIERRSTVGTIFDARVRIVKGGVVGATDRSAAGTWPLMDTVQTYGGSSDLWGDTWTAADINGAGFGVALSADDNVDTAAVDAFSITVFYNLCPDTPRGGCRAATKNVLVVKDKTPDTKDKLIWKWIKGAATTQPEFANPTATAQYSICLYQGMVGTTLFAEANVFPSLTLWQPISTKGYKYKDPAGAQDGITKIVLKGSTDPNKSKIILKGKGMNLPTMTPDFDLPVTIQAVNTDTNICWESVFTAAIKNDTTKGIFKAKQ